MAFQLCTVLQWWRILFHSLFCSYRASGNSISYFGIWFGVQIQNILFKSAPQNKTEVWSNRVDFRSSCIWCCNILYGYSCMGYSLSWSKSVSGMGSWSCRIFLKLCWWRLYNFQLVTSDTSDSSGTGYCMGNDMVYFKKRAELRNRQSIQSADSITLCYNGSYCNIFPDIAGS